MVQCNSFCIFINISSQWLLRLSMRAQALGNTITLTVQTVTVWLYWNAPWLSMQIVCYGLAGVSIASQNHLCSPFICWSFTLSIIGATGRVPVQTCLIFKVRASNRWQTKPFLLSNPHTNKAWCIQDRHTWHLPRWMCFLCLAEACTISDRLQPGGSDKTNSGVNQPKLTADTKLPVKQTAVMFHHGMIAEPASQHKCALRQHGLTQTIRVRTRRVHTGIRQTYKTQKLQESGPKTSIHSFERLGWSDSWHLSLWVLKLLLVTDIAGARRLGCRSMLRCTSPI